MYQVNHYGGIRAYSDKQRLRVMERAAERNRRLVEKVLTEEDREPSDPRVQYANSSR